MTPDEVRGKAHVEIPRHPPGFFYPSGRDSNVERSSERDLTLSREVRSVPGVRHWDLDMLQVCPYCCDDVVLIESSRDSQKPTRYLRRHAQRLNITGDTYAFLVINNDDGTFRSSRIVYWPGADAGLPPPTYRDVTDWDSLRAALLDLQYIHQLIYHPDDPGCHERTWLQRHPDPRREPCSC